MGNYTQIYLSNASGNRRKTQLSRTQVANTFFSRLVGLLSRKQLGPDEALLIVPCTSIHTIGMRFTIDVVFLDKDNKVLGISLHVKPYRMRWAPKGTVSVLEVSDGNVNSTGIHLDDTLLFD